MALPYPTKVVLPFDIATAQDMNERHANDVALAAGTGIGDKAIKAAKIDPTTQSASPSNAFYDSGWVSVSVGSGYTTSDFAVRRIGSVVYLRGAITRTSGAYTNSSVAVCTLPAGYRPSAYTRWVLSTYATPNASSIVANFYTSGIIEVGSNGTTNNADAYFGGMSFLVD